MLVIIYDYGGQNDFDGFGLFAGIAALGVLTVILLGVLAAVIFYLLTMQKALNRCSPANRTLEPGMVWLQLIPVFGMVWSFIVVLKTSESLGAELRHRGITGMESSPGRGVGLASCILSAWVSLVGWMPYIGQFMSSLPGLAGIVCWIVYWVRISRTIRVLDQSPVNAGEA